MTALEQMGKNAKIAARKLGTLQEKKDTGNLGSQCHRLAERRAERHDFGADGQTAPDPGAH